MNFVFSSGSLSLSPPPPNPEESHFLTESLSMTGYMMKIFQVKLTLMIEDPRELERRRLLGIDLDEVTREDLVAALVDVCPLPTSLFSVLYSC